jgi:hypothetical protein
VLPYSLIVVRLFYIVTSFFFILEGHVVLSLAARREEMHGLFVHSGAAHVKLHVWAFFWWLVAFDLDLHLLFFLFVFFFVVA